MEANKKSNILKISTLGAAAAACILRAAHYSLGTDGRGLLVANHWSVLLLWAVSIAFALALLLLGGSITGSGKAAGVRPASPAAAAGCFALGAALLVAGVQNFGDFPLPADFLIWALGLCAGAGMIPVGICRLTSKKPYFLMHALLCLYTALRMVAMYRRWSSDPQLQDYGFYLMAHAALMLTAYHHAAFDAGMGSHRSLWICSLASVYLCCAALPRCDEILLPAAAAVWAFTNLTVLPVRKRRIRPVVPQDAQQPEG